MYFDLSRSIQWNINRSYESIMLIAYYQTRLLCFSKYTDAGYILEKSVENGASCHHIYNCYWNILCFIEQNDLENLVKMLAAKNANCILTSAVVRRDCNRQKHFGRGSARIY